MSFEQNDVGGQFSPLASTVSGPLAQPVSQPTGMFGGSIPSVHFAPVTPLHPGLVEPTYHAAPAHVHTQFAEAHAIVGNVIDVRG